MSQTYPVPIGAGETLSASRAKLNSAFDALLTKFSGATEPSPASAYQPWIDTTANLLKIRNAANDGWVTIGTPSLATLGLLSRAGGTMTGDIAMGGTQKLTGLAAGSGAGDSVRYEQAILASGANAFGADQSMGNHKLTSVATPGASGDAATKGYVDSAVAGVAGMPTGGLVIWATDTAPTGYLLCYGQAVSRTTYAALFAVISTTYGVGDGSTTFNLPDLRGRVPLGQDDMGGSSANRVTATEADNLGQASGEETHTLTTGEMPAHTHDLDTHASQNNNSNPCVSTDINSSNDTQYVISAAAQSTGGDGAHNNLQPFITLNYVIKT